MEWLRPTALSFPTTTKNTCRWPARRVQRPASSLQFPVSSMLLLACQCSPATCGPGSRTTRASQTTTCHSSGLLRSTPYTEIRRTGATFCQSVAVAGHHRQNDAGLAETSKMSRQRDPVESAIVSNSAQAGLSRQQRLGAAARLLSASCTSRVATVRTSFGFRTCEPGFHVARCGAI